MASAQSPSTPLDLVPPIDKSAEPFFPPAPPPPSAEGPPLPPDSPKSPVLLDPTKVQAGSFATLLGPMATMFSPVVGNLRTRVTLSITDYPNQEVQGQAAHLGFAQGNLNVLVPVYQDSTDEWHLNAHVRAGYYDTNAILPTSNIAFPNELYSIGFGAGYRHLFANDWIAGVNVNVGSASDKPFSNINVIQGGINAFVRIPSGETNAWLLSINYSPLSEIGFPIPGVAYLWAPSPQFNAAIGLPMFIMYRPLEDLAITMSYAPIRNIHAQATYRIWRQMRVYVSYSWSNESYFLADREDDRSRLFYYDQRLTTGLQYNVNQSILVDVSGGYAFDRFFFQGESFQDSHDDRVNVGDGFFVTARATFRW